MTLFVGIDIGTSGIKVALVDDLDVIHAYATRGIKVSRPNLGWSEQHPDLWWTATLSAFDELQAKHSKLMQRIVGIGFSGQMLGAVLLDKANKPTFPCLLWNDQRSSKECQTLLERVPDIGLRTGASPAPGFTAPKILWLEKHFPEVLEQTKMLLLPKDYVRLQLTGECATEPTDASCTLLLDCQTKKWDTELVTAAGWSVDRLPKLRASFENAGLLKTTLQKRWQIPQPVPVAAGAGDNFACAIGVGVSKPGDCVATIGTSGVLCTVDDQYHPAPQYALMTGPHAAPNTYLSMGVVMSATQSLNWIAQVTRRSVFGLAAEVDKFVKHQGVETAPIMRPSLAGIRTPHNLPNVGGMIRDLTPLTDAPALAYAVMEGVAFQFLECIEAQQAANIQIEQIYSVGGGSRNRLWVQLLATLFGKNISLPKGSAAAASVGAARLASVASGHKEVHEALSQKPKQSGVIEPIPAFEELLQERYARFKELPF